MIPVLVSDPTLENCKGFCRDCGCDHSLPEGNARAHARELMREFEQLRRLDYLQPELDADPRLSFDQLFPGERGHMFGVMECDDAAGNTVVLRAFSSLHGGIRTVAGWVPPILRDEIFNPLVLPGQAEIRRLTREMQELEKNSPEYQRLFGQRRRISQELMPKVHDEYRLHNFRGERRAMRDAWIHPHGLPGGVGDCCAPKLIDHAARNGLIPTGICEFFWGGPHRSGSFQAGRYYPACREKCQPILGFMLCGLAQD